MVAVNWKKALELLAQPGPRLLSGIHVLLVLALSYSLAQMTWRLLPGTVDESMPMPAAASSAATSAAAGKSLEQQISQWHLFGEVETEVAVPKPVDLPETNLKLTLRGMIASSDPTEARAIVADASGKENFYKIDDQLPGNAVLKEIHDDRIVIQRGSRYETLKLPKESLGLSQVNSSPGRVTTVPSANETYSLGEYRNALLNNPQQVADLVRIQPKKVGGKFVGYQLQPGRDAKLLSRYGLMPGDVVTSINGIVLDNPSKGFGLLKDLATVDTLDLEIERNGVRQRFTLPVN